MKRVHDELRLAAGDITTFAACRHATALDLAVADGHFPRPFRADASAALLRERGLAHERACLAKMAATRTVEEIPADAADASDRTMDAMQRGVEVIYQGSLVHGRWLGRPDFLQRVESPRGSLAWSYEAVDAKLARSAKASALLQMCFYSDLLSHVQGVLPVRMALVFGDMRHEEFLTSRYAAFFRYLRSCLETAVVSPGATYPEPVEHCDVCAWFTQCDARRRSDDHLSLVARITGSQRRALHSGAVLTVGALAKLPLARPTPVEGIGFPAFERIREQARIQVEGRGAGRLIYELLPNVEEGRGIAQLPAPSPGDLFVDFEGDPFALGDGLEYLLGIVEPVAEGVPEARYTAIWAFDQVTERAAFEELMRIIAQRRAQYPEMHVYHYAPYEQTALKRLAGRHSTCVDELDTLLRGKVFVDLYAAVRQGLRASVESYSIKRLEPLYGFVRTIRLRDANACLAAFEAWLEVRGTSTPHDELRDGIEGYNRDDCISALRLRAWLEERRAELEASSGRPIPRPPLISGEPSEGLAEQLGRVRLAMDALLAGLPAEPELRTDEQNARYVLAHLLEWHRREEKSEHWEYHRLCELPEDELQQEKTAIGGLVYEGVVRQEKRSLVHRYRFPPQDHALDRALEIHDPRTESPAGKLVSIDDVAATIELKRGVSSAVPHPTALVPRSIVPSTDLRESLLHFGEHLQNVGMIAAAPYAAAIALLRREPPPPSNDDASSEKMAVRRALAVNGSVLPVQGPPGTGKTYLGARMIVALLREGRRVGITANSHKVITKLLNEACAAAREAGVSLRAVQKGGDSEDSCSKDPCVTVVTDNDTVLQSLVTGVANVAAGTAWLWARPQMVGGVDVLLVDEAGQMTLANVLAAAPAANGIVLLGDPQQLDQPQKGVHPPGTAVSALGHILGDAETLTRDRGLFLEETWRMHPDVCGFISEVFYEGRLRSRPDLTRIRLDTSAFSGTGLRFVPVAHRGNQSESVEEAEAVAKLVQKLLGGVATWTDRHGETRSLCLDDILIVAPYNAQVGLIRSRVPNANVGTVDKFQGQQAPIAIYSMATSSPEDAPRGAEFLYSGHRFNVAISRARCAAFLVASPSLFEMRCKTERQMALVNAFCRYLEVSQELLVEPRN